MEYFFIKNSFDITHFIIKNSSIREYDEVEVKNTNNTPEPENKIVDNSSKICGICLDTPKSCVGIDENHHTHVFCKNCINTWYIQCIDANRPFTNPITRSIINYSNIIKK